MARVKPVSGPIPAETMARTFRLNGPKLREAAKEGFVRGEWVTRRGRRIFLATPEDWRAGLEAWEKAHALWVPPGHIGASEAAKLLGVGDYTLRNAVKAGLVPGCLTIKHRANVFYYATLEQWREGLRRLREKYPATDPDRHRKKIQREAEKGPPAPSVSPERARERIEAMTPRQRFAYRLLIWGLLMGYGIPKQWNRKAADDLHRLLQGGGG